jgi:hypothetical protein
MPQAPDWLGDVLWLVLGLGLVAMLFGELRWLRGLRARPPEHCRACGADLPPPSQGASPGGARACDQCGAPVLTTSTAAALSSNPLIAWLQQRPLAGVGAAWGLILWAVMSLAWPLLGGSGEAFQLVPALTGLPLFVLGGLVFGLTASALRGRGG